MLLSDFCFAVMERIEQGDYGVKPAVKLFTDGYTSSLPEELDFIHETNLKYHHRESDTLIGTYFQLSWQREDGGVSYCRIDASYLMEMYETGGWESADRVIRENIQQGLLVKTDVINSMKDYELAKKHLFLRPLSFPLNRVELRNAVYQKVGDIALTLYVRINDASPTLLSAKVPKQQVEEWNLPLDQIFAETMDATALYAPPRLYFYPYECEHVPYMTGVFMGEGEGRITKIDPMTSPMLTTTRLTNGAIAAFYPGVKERIAEIMGSSFYLAFTSNNEAILHSVKKTTAKLADRILKDSNRRFSEEVLTNSLYYYDAEKGALSKLKL